VNKPLEQPSGRFYGREYAERVPMNYRHQIKGGYFLVLIFFLNIMALLPVVFLIRNPTPHERVVMTGIWAYMAINTAGMVWCLGAVLPEPLSTYNRSQNFLYRRRTGKPGCSVS
jgi:hypothetical protein